MRSHRPGINNIITNSCLMLTVVPVAAVVVKLKKKRNIADFQRRWPGWLPLLCSPHWLILVTYENFNYFPNDCLHFGNK